MYFPHSVLGSEWGISVLRLPRFRGVPVPMWFFHSWQKHNVKDMNKVFASPCRFKTWMRSEGKVLITLGTSCIRGFVQLPIWCPLRSNSFIHSGSHQVITEACTSHAEMCVVWRYGRSLGLYALWTKTKNSAETHTIHVTYKTFEPHYIIGQIINVTKCL